MNLQKNINLQKYNTFGVNAKAKFLIEVKSEDELKQLFLLPEFKESKKLFLGEGSNILLTKDVDGFVVLSSIKGIEILKEEGEDIYIKAMGGEQWHDLVVFAVDHGYWGIEELALIPGTVGAAPVQNIGAYGAELKDVLESVEAYNVDSGIKKIFSRDECNFGYRDSIFKHKKDKYFITSVVFKLKKSRTKKEIYKILDEYVKEKKMTIKEPKDLFNAVMAIRKSKLPDPKILGNGGSFFKNVYVNEQKLKKLQNIYPEIPFFVEKQSGEVKIKIPTGWLVEQCGPADSGVSWKGYRTGKVGVYEKQALVLVNYGGATGKEILDLAKKIATSVKEKFGLELTPEVNVV